MSRSADQAYQLIRAHIVDGKLGPGEQLTELELAALTGVSRTPVREALRRLESEALIVRSDSKRMFVAEHSLADLEEMYRLRALLEGEAAARAAVYIDDEQLASLEALNVRIRASITRKMPDHAGFLEANAQFHTEVLAASRSPRLLTIVAGLVERPVVRRTVIGYGSAQLERSLADHNELIQALRSHDAAWAQAVMSAHIRRAYHSFVQSSLQTLR